MTNKNIEKISIPMPANSVGLWVSHLGSGDKVRGRQLWPMGSTWGLKSEDLSSLRIVLHISVSYL